MAAVIDQETPGAEGGALPFDIRKWLTENNLAQYTKEFIEQNVEVEELLCLSEEDLRSEATHFGITRAIHKNRFVKAVQHLIESSQKYSNKNTDNKQKKAITITKEESDALDTIKLQIKKMNDLKIRNDHILQNINIISTKCTNDIKHLFDGITNALKSRQTQLITKTKQITDNKLLMIVEHQSNINEYIHQLKEFQTCWSKSMLNQKEEPGQSIQQRKQNIILKSNELVKKGTDIDYNLMDLQNKMNITFILNTKDRDIINESISNIGYIDSNEPPHSPILVIDDENISDITAQIMIKFVNNNKQCLAERYCIEIAEYNELESEEKKGEMDEMKLEWKQVVPNGIIDENTMDKRKVEIKDLTCNTKYILQCKCRNKYGWSAFCPYLMFVTKQKVFRMESAILTENEKQILCKSILMSLLGKNGDEVKVELLFRASRDGFNAQDFHSKCDGKKRTIVIVESNLGNVFGGYTKISWSKDNEWHTDGSCCLFLCRDLNNNYNNKDFEIYPIKQSHQGKAVKHYASHGPCFGVGHDLLIVNASNITDSRSDGVSFINLKGNKLSGSLTQLHNKYWHFVVRDYEVFQIL